MHVPSPLPRPLVAALLCLSLLGPGAALAERADRDKPMNIEADNLRYEDTTQTSVFTGNVVITKGTIVIRGHRVEVRQDPQGNQFGVATAQPGQRAFFRQKREGLDEFIEGEGERIDYDSQADTVKFIGQAILRRYRGTVLADETLGRQIVYDNTRETFVVDGGGSTADNPSGRVRALLTPAPKPAAGGTAEPAPAPGNGAVLRPSPRLNEGQR